MNERDNEVNRITEGSSNIEVKPESYAHLLRNGIIVASSLMAWVSTFTVTLLELNSRGFTSDIAYLASFGVGGAAMAISDGYIPQLIGRLPLFKK